LNDFSNSPSSNSKITIEKIVRVEEYENMELTEENLAVLFRSVVSESFALIMMTMTLATLLSLLVFGLVMKILDDNGYRIHFSIPRFNTFEVDEEVNDASEDDTSESTEEVNDASEDDTSEATEEVNDASEDDVEGESASEEHVRQTNTLTVKEFMDAMVSPDVQPISFISPTSSTLPIQTSTPSTSSSTSSTSSTPSTSSILTRDEESDELERKKFEEMCKKASSVPLIPSARIESHMPPASYMSLRSSVGSEDTLIPTSSNVKVNVSDIMKTYNLPEYKEDQKSE
jgi:hypothetical protein